MKKNVRFYGRDYEVDLNRLATILAETGPFKSRSLYRVEVNGKLYPATQVFELAIDEPPIGLASSLLFGVIRALGLKIKYVGRG